MNERNSLIFVQNFREFWCIIDENFDLHFVKFLFDKNQKPYSNLKIKKLFESVKYRQLWKLAIKFIHSLDFKVSQRILVLGFTSTTHWYFSFVALGIYV